MSLTYTGWSVGSYAPAFGLEVTPVGVKTKLYRVIAKSLCTRWLQYRKLQVMFKVSPASLQTFTDTRLTLTPSVLPNSNYVIVVSEWNCLKYFCVFVWTSPKTPLGTPLNVTLRRVELSWLYVCVVPGFRREADETCALMIYYAASSGNSLPTFRDNLLVPFSTDILGNPIKSLPLQTGPIGCPETSARNYHYSLRNSSEERSFLRVQLLQVVCKISGSEKRLNTVRSESRCTLGVGLRYLDGAFLARGHHFQQLL
jgi:hypothetical protein